MKVLHVVESYLPAKHGMAEVVRQISENLVSYGYEVTVATSTNSERTTNSINGVSIVSFDITGNIVNGICGNAQAYIDFVKRGNFDIITCFAAQNWATDLLLPHLKDLSGSKVFVPTGFSGLHNPDYDEYFFKMPVWMSQFDMNIFLSQTYQDIEFAIKHHIINRIFIPNGASEKEFTGQPTEKLKIKLGIPDSNSLILHVGSYTGSKGHLEALRIFIKAKIKNSTLLFIGQNPETTLQSFGGKHRYFDIPLQKMLRNKHIIAVDLDRQNTIDAFYGSDLFLFPSRIECSPIVIFEAAASGTAFLATKVGNIEEIIEWTAGGVVMDTKFKNNKGYANIEHGAVLLEKLIKDDQLRYRLGESGQNSWKKQFTWEVITKQYESLYLSISNKKHQ